MISRDLILARRDRIARTVVDLAGLAVEGGALQLGEIVQQ